MDSLPSSFIMADALARVRRMQWVLKHLIVSLLNIKLNDKNKIKHVKYVGSGSSSSSNILLLNQVLTLLCVCYYSLTIRKSKKKKMWCAQKTGIMKQDQLYEWNSKLKTQTKNISYGNLWIFHPSFALLLVLTFHKINLESQNSK